MKVTFGRRDIRIGKEGHRDFAVKPGNISQNIGSHAKSIWPQVSLYCGWPPLLGVKQHSSRHLLMRPDMPFRQSVLPMRVYSTETLRLSLFLAGILEQVVNKPTIISVVMADGYSMRFREVFKCLLCFDRFRTRC
jgi:hypothetical protein